MKSDVSVAVGCNRQSSAVIGHLPKEVEPPGGSFQPLTLVDLRPSELPS